MTTSVLAEARMAELDAADALASKREQFELPDGVYLDGNSLGPLPTASRLRCQQLVEQQWGQDLIASWNKHHWIDLPTTAAEKLAPLLGARADQLICCDSISINLHKLIPCALALNPGRSSIVSLEGNFPTDLYVAQSQLSATGSGRLVTCSADELDSAIDEDTAVVLLTQVDFRSGQLLDVEKITALAHDRGALVIWDLAHSAGVVPLQLDQWQVDFAVGCGYKYLNGGPGAPAFVYAASRHHDQLQQPLSGWMGHRAPFSFSPDYEPAGGMAVFLSGTPPVLSLSALDAALDLFADVSIDQIRAKSLALTREFMALVDETPALQELELITPRQDSLRGSQLAYRHPDAYAICQALIADGVVGDFRDPDILRLGFSPLFLRFADLHRAVQALSDIISSGRYREPRFQQRQKVT